MSVGDSVPIKPLMSGGLFSTVSTGLLVGLGWPLILWFLRRNLAVLSLGQEHLMAAEDSLWSDLGGERCWM